MTKRLYYHQTDGGAEYLCTSPVDGTDEGDLHTAFIRLDGEPELLNPSASVAPELLEALKAAYQWIENIYHLPNGEGTGILSKTMPDPREIGIDTMRDAIRKAEGEP